MQNTLNTSKPERREKYIRAIIYVLFVIENTYGYPLVPPTFFLIWFLQLFIFGFCNILI